MGGKTWIDNGDSNTYTFTGLTSNTSYTVHVRVTNGVEKTANSNKDTITSTLSKPTFSENVEGEVVITYPSGCSNGKTCSYQENDGIINTVNGTTTVNVGEDGTIVATVTDGVNTVSSTYTVVRRNLYVSSTGSDTTGYGTISKPYATLTKAYDSATSTSQATIYVMDKITQTDTTNMDENKEIVLTSYSTNGTINSLFRGDSLTDYMINQTLGTLTLESITIDGNNISSDYGLLLVEGGTINVNDKTTIQNSISLKMCGGAIRLDDDSNSVLNLNGGTITNNQAFCGGAIHGGFTTIVNINNGEIRNNTASTDGGGVYSGGTVNLNGGEITDNVALLKGGGLSFDYISAETIFNINGGTINNNTIKDGLTSNNTYNVFTSDAKDKGVMITTPDFSYNSGEKYYITTALNDNYGIAVQDASTANGASVILYNNTNTNNHKWLPLITNIIDGEVTFGISARHSYDRWLWVNNNSSTSGTKIVISELNNHQGGFWNIKPAGNGTYYIQNSATGLCLDLYDSQVVNNAVIQTYTCGQTTNQKWKFVKTNY